jgi:hypothetical protein
VLKRLMVLITAAAIAMAPAGTAVGDESSGNPDQSSRQGPPATSGDGRGAQVTHCNAEPGGKGNIVFHVRKNEVLHNNGTCPP